jgi:hypothetical protein
VIAPKQYAEDLGYAIEQKRGWNRKDPVGEDSLPVSHRLNSSSQLFFQGQ